VFVELNDKLKEQLNMTMNQVPMSNDIKPLQLVKNFYRACVDQKTINKIGLDHIAEKMKFLGGWPVVKSHDWDEKKWWYQRVVQDIELIGFPSNNLFEFGLIQDLKNGTRRILIVDQPGLGLSREFLVRGIDEKLVKAYHSYQVDMAILFGAEKEDAEKEMRDVLDFEIKLANVSDCI
jgi:neprilysin